MQDTTRCILKQENNLEPFGEVSHLEKLVDGCSWACPYDRQRDWAFDPAPLETSRFFAGKGLGRPTQLAEVCADPDAIK